MTRRVLAAASAFYQLGANGGQMRRPLIAVAGMLGLASCATGPTLQETWASMPAAPSDKARIYFYRTGSPIGSAIQPSILLNSQKIGDSVPGGVFFCDVRPGTYAATVSTEIEKSTVISAEAGKQYFIKMDWGFGWIVARVHIESVPPSVGEVETQTLSVLKDTNCPSV